MAANTSPIWTLTPNVDWVVGVTTANTTDDLTSGTIYLAFTAGANGSYVDRVIWQPLGTNVASAGRLWLNNGSTTGTAANNSQLRDITLTATTNSEVALIGQYEMTLGLAIDAGFRLYVTLGTTVATGFNVTVIGGDY